MAASRRIWIAGGLTAIALGCGKPSAPVAVVEPAPVTVVSEPTVPEPKPDLTTGSGNPSSDSKPVDPRALDSFITPVKDGVKKTPTRPILPKPIAEVPPAVPITQVQTPKPPKVEPPKPTDAPKPEDPPKEPKPIEYPKFVDGKDLARWIKELSAANQPDPQQREFALRTLPQFGPEARKPSIGPIADLIFKDPDPGVRIVAITIISNMGYDIRDQITPAVSALRTCMLNTASGSIVRLFCVRSLTSFGPEAVAAIPEIRGAGQDISWETRMAVAKALGQVGAPASEKGEPSDSAAKFLLNVMLKDVCAAVRMEAVQSLLAVGPPKPKDPADYIKDIKTYLEPVENRIKIEKDKGILCWLYLLNIMYDDRVLVDKDKDYLKKIASYIKFPDSPMVRMHAINACAALGPKAAPVIPQIVEALNYDEPELVIAAMSALAQIGLEARGTAPELEKIKAGSKDPVKPPEAPKDWKPDLTLRLVAEDALLYVTGKKKLGEEMKKDKEKEKDK